MNPPRTGWSANWKSLCQLAGSSNRFLHKNFHVQPYEIQLVELQPWEHIHKPHSSSIEMLQNYHNFFPLLLHLNVFYVFNQQS